MVYTKWQKNKLDKFLKLEIDVLIDDWIKYTEKEVIDWHEFDLKFHARKDIQ
jgi:hypothetical protein